LCTAFEDIVFGAALSADKPVPLTISLLALTSAALLKMKGCSSAVEALCGQPKSRISSTSSYTKRLNNEVPPPMLQVLDDGEFFRLALPREYLSRER
jgi:hypothetical protein